MLKKILSVLLIFLMVFSVFACGTPEPAATPTPEVTETPVPTDTPEPTPEPTAVPKITDAWYTERNNNIVSYLKQFAGLSDSEANAKVALMAIDPDQKKVAFTFDDGPNATYTPMILDILEQYNARATFFVQGQNLDGNEDILKRMLTLGCEIGTHTWAHSDIEEFTSKSDMEQAILSVHNSLKEKLGYTSHLFRPPYISYGKKDSDTRNFLVEIMKDNDIAVINHSRSTHDTHDDYTTDMIYERGVAETDETGRGLNNSFILCHDKSQSMVDAFKKIVPELQARGYQLVTVSELINCSPDGFHAGWIYSKAD